MLETLNRIREYRIIMRNRIFIHESRIYVNFIRDKKKFNLLIIGINFSRIKLEKFTRVKTFLVKLPIIETWS